MEYKYILFDLDGTLTDSSQGITRCVKYALEKLGYEIPSEDMLLKFIGPPLQWGFEHVIGMEPGEAERATTVFRERYDTKGLFENTPYQGITDVLKALTEGGFVMAVATGKPEPTAKRVIEHFGLDVYFSEICGSTYDGSRRTKDTIIEETIRRLGIPEQERGSILMVGDRMHDMIGAAKCRIRSLGVYYGFADKGELEANGADFIINEVKDYYEFFGMKYN